MTQTSKDPPRLEQSIHEVTSRLAEMGRDGDLSTPVGDWTAHEHLAHVSLAQAYFARWVSGDLVDYPGNEAVRTSLPQRSGADLAEELLENTEEFLAAWYANLSEARPHPGFGMLPLIGREWGPYSLCHLLLHACLMADVFGHPPVLRPAYVPLTLPFLWAAIPAMSKREVAERLGGLLVIDLGAAAPRFGIRMAEAGVSIEHAPSADADCVLSTDPATFFRVSWGLLSQTYAMERGLLIVSGARPELGVAYKEFFISPGRGETRGPGFHEAGGKYGGTFGARRTVLIDYLSLPVAARVDSARPHDSKTGRMLLDHSLPGLPRVGEVLAGLGFEPLVKGIQRRHKVTVTTKGWRKPNKPKGFKLIRPLWKLEDCFAQLGRWRRLSRSYEATTESATTWLHVACVGYLLTKL